jgi:tetratricopeptide (TPR) repeat protein
MAHSARCTYWNSLTLLFLSVLSVAQQGSPRAAVRSAQVQPSVPAQAGAEGPYAKEAIVFDRSATKVVYEVDGSGVQEDTVVVHILSQAGVQEFAVLAFPYTSYNQTVEIDYVRVKKPDGTVVVTPDYNIQDMPADVTRRAPMYSDIHEKHITVKALGVGDVLEYLVRYRTVKPQVPGQFWYQHTFHKYYIAKDDELEINVPRGKYVKIESPDYPPQTKEDSANKIYTWKTTNLSAKDREELRKQPETPKPSVQLTTFRDWAEVGRWYVELQNPQLRVTPQIQTKSAELTKGLTSDDDKIRAIYKYVSTRFHYISLSFGIGRYQPHAAEDVLENEYGDCKDKHTLLAALLKAAGYDAWPALINASRKIDPALPSPGQFDHVITVAPRGESLLWLDTTPEVAPYGVLMASLRDREALVIPTNKVASLEKAASLMKTPPQLPFRASETFDLDGKLSSDGTLTAHVQVTDRSDKEVLYRMAFRSVSPAQWKELGQRISYNSGFHGEVSSVTASAPEETDKPFQLSYEYTRKSFGDWKNHRVVAPLPWFGIESTDSDEKKPEEPFALGALGDYIYKSKTSLPAGYASKYSDKLDVNEDFAEYHATYAIENGVLTANRRLVIKKSEIPAAEWERYKKFCKALSEERDRYINLATGETEYPPGEGPKQAESGATSAKVGADSASSSMPSNAYLQGIMAAAAIRNPEAARYMRQGIDAGDRRDLAQAEESFRKVIALDPKYPGVHGALGWVYMSQQNLEGTLKELRLEIEYHPEIPGTYQMLAQVLAATQHKDEAIEVYRKWLKVDPANHEAAIKLSRMLSDSKKNAEAIAVLEDAIKLSPDSSKLQYALGYAYLRNKQTQQGVPLLKKAGAADSKGDLLNDVAYSMADMNVELDLAKEYGDKALAQAEGLSMKASDEAEGLQSTVHLGATWDTVGWVYFRRGDYEKALTYVRASWLLGQTAVVGDHLGQIYEKLGKKQEAIHAYKLAIASVNGNMEQVRKHYEQLTGQKAGDADSPLLRRNSKNVVTTSPGEELSRMRTVTLSSAPHDQANATFTIVFSPGKVDDVKYVSGSESLKAMSTQIPSAKFKVEFPDAGPARLFRRGMLVCGKVTGCSVVLLLPNDVYQVGQMETKN